MPKILARLTQAGRSRHFPTIGCFLGFVAIISNPRAFSGIIPFGHVKVTVSRETSRETHGGL